MIEPTMAITPISFMSKSKKKLIMGMDSINAIISNPTA
jgi:hypothetical protein